MESEVRSSNDSKAELPKPADGADPFFMRLKRNCDDLLNENRSKFAGDISVLYSQQGSVKCTHTFACRLVNTYVPLLYCDVMIMYAYAGFEFGEENYWTKNMRCT